MEAVFKSKSGIFLFIFLVKTFTSLAANMPPGFPFSIQISTQFIPHSSSLIPNSTGLAVNNLWLCPDTSFATATTHFVAAGSLVQILGKSAAEQLDRDQNQQFFWYKIETRDGKKGWVFGDGLAIFQPVENLPDALKKWQNKPISLGAGFEDAQFWLAQIEGHDSKEYHFEFYGEYYFVVTNAAGQSVFLRYAGQSAMGGTSLQHLFISDLTGDGRPEIALETGSREQGDDFEKRVLEVFQLQNSALRRVFSEDLTLIDQNGFPTPCLFKNVELEAKTIRIEFIDFQKCKNAGTPPGEDCLDFVTYTYSWNLRSGQFEMLYEPTRMPPEATAANFGIALRLEPNKMGTAVAVLGAGEKVRVLRFLDKILLENGQKRVESFLFVKTAAGYLGYVPASKMIWQKTRHAEVLTKYCQEPPLLRSVWSRLRRDDFQAVKLLVAAGQQAGQ